jgi:hypothetical protein
VVHVEEANSGLSPLYCAGSSVYSVYSVYILRYIFVLGPDVSVPSSATYMYTRR